MKQLAVALFTLPDGRYVFQRRTDDAPVNAGLLGNFGGHVDLGETNDDAIRRELTEETSLDVDQLDIQHHSDFVVDREGEDVEYHVFSITLENMDFEVHEGVRAEAYSLEEALARDDLTSSVRYMLEKLKEATE